MYFLPFTLMMCSCTLIALPLARSAPIDGLCYTATRRIETSAQSTQCESKLISRRRRNKHLQSSDELLGTLINRAYRKMFFSWNQRKAFVHVLEKNESQYDAVESTKSGTTHSLNLSLRDRLVSNITVLINIIYASLANVMKYSREPLDAQSSYVQIVSRNKTMIIVHVVDGQQGDRDIHSVENLKFKTFAHDGMLHIEVDEIGFTDKNQSTLPRKYRRSVYKFEVEGNLKRVSDKKIYLLPSRESISGFYIVLPLVEGEMEKGKKINFYEKKTYPKPLNHVKKELVRSSMKRDSHLIDAKIECRKQYEGKKELTVEQVVCECDKVYSYYTEKYTECLLKAAKRLMRTANRAGADDVVSKLQFRTRICVRGSLAGKRKHLCLRMELKSVIRSWNAFVRQKRRHTRTM